MRDCLHAVKFRQHRPLGQWLGDQLGAVAAQHLRRTDYDMIIPVPLHRARTRDRGFNQSALLAYRIGAAIELPVATRALRRIGPATEQHLLGTAQRLRNMHTFQAATRSLGGQRILLVDDILTTGATANACTRALYNAGATSVDFIALASN
jgi:ComF family protein